MYKIIEKIPDNIPEDKINESYAYYIIFNPYIMKKKKYNKDALFQSAIKDFSYDKNIFEIKEIIFNETILEKFCSHFAALTYFGINMSLIVDFPLTIFSTYIKNNQIFLYDKDEEKYVKIYLDRVF